LILDEPTSALDINAETAVLDAIQRLIKGRTALIIAHRASALRNCNIILILEDGRVIEMTTEVGSVLSGMTAVSIQM
jgi:ABC-type multidrug transport system fused ATPase/permease subunit